MRWTDTVLIDAPAALVWRLTTDIEAWPAISPTVTSVQRLDDGPLRIGSQARIKQPGQPAAVWTVTEFEPDAGFSWRAVRPGLVLTATHRVAPEPIGCRNTLHLDAAGPLSRPLGLLLGGVFRKVLRTENAAFKAAAERQAFPDLIRHAPPGRLLVVNDFRDGIRWPRDLLTAPRPLALARLARPAQLLAPALAVRSRIPRDRLGDQREQPGHPRLDPPADAACSARARSARGLIWEARHPVSGPLPPRHRLGQGLHPGLPSGPARSADDASQHLTLEAAVPSSGWQEQSRRVLQDPARRR